VKKLPIALAMVASSVATAAPVDAMSATKPATVAGSTRLYMRDVASTVITDGPATITLTNVAYRHPEEVQATLVVTEAGSYTIADRCKPITLPHDWIVRVNGVEIARGTLKCE
jgi:hypothetical protein